MKFVKRQPKLSPPHWVGRKDGFVFKYTRNRYGNGRFYVCIHHSKNDIHFNSLWQNIDFENPGEAEWFCETFRPENYECVGADAPNVIMSNKTE